MVKIMCNKNKDIKFRFAPKGRFDMTAVKRNLVRRDSVDFDI